MTKRVLTANALTALTMIGEETAKGSETFLYVSPTDPVVAELSGLIIQNPNLVNENGSLATRATAEGVAELELQKADAPAPAPAATPAEKPVITLMNISVSKEAKKRTGGGQPSVYPFDKVPAPSDDNKTPGFFIPATAAKPEPWKSVVTAVGNYNRSKGTETGAKTFTDKNGNAKVRKSYDYAVKFEVIEHTTAEGVKGAYVYRTK